MAIKRQQNWLSQQQVAVAHLRSVESAVQNDIDQILRGWVTQEGNPYFIRGFRIKHVLAGPAIQLEVVVDDGAVMHSTATEAGTILTVPSGTANEVLDSANAKVSGSFVAGTTNFIALDYTRSADASTNDLVRFWDPDTNEEFTKTVPLARTLDYSFVISAVGFGTLLPIASVDVDVSGNVTSITDCRPMLLRLGSGGAIPDPSNVYSWPNGPGPASTADGRAELPSTSSDPANTPFDGGDKEIASLKNWFDAMMSRIKEMDGGTYWYSQSIASLSGLAQNQNVHILDSGVVWSWNLSTQVLTWSDVVEFQIPGADANNTLAAGNVTIGAGQCAYVEIDRTLAVLGPVTTINVADDDAVPLGEDIFVFARRDGDDVLVGTHSFRVKPTDATESDYSDHLAKDKLFKPIITQGGADTSIHIYPSQRVSGNKRRFVYINPKISSLFPRTGYLAGTYDGGADNDQLTDITFSISGANILVDATLPSIVPPTLMSDAWATWDSSFTPVLIAISDADAITITSGAHWPTLAQAVADSAMPVPLNADYPVAVVIIEMVGGVIQPITEDYLIDRRPTGAGGSGTGTGGTGVVVEYVAVGGETLIDLGALGITSYTPGVADLAVIENGIELFVGAGADYLETDSTHITLNYPAVAGDRYKFRTGAGITPGVLGDVVGPAGATDNALARFNLATGKIIKNSVAILNDLGDLSGINDLTMTGTLTGGASPFIIETVEADGVAAVGFQLNTQNALSTDGSKILSLLNNSIEHLAVRRGDNYVSTADLALMELFDKTGALALQFSLNAASNVSLYPQGTGFTIEQLDDPVFGAGYKDNSIIFSQSTNPNITLNTELNGVGTVLLEVSGGSVGGGPGTYPHFFVDVTDDLTAEGTAELGLFTEDTSAVNRTDVRFNAIAKGYIGIASTGAFFGASALTTPSSWLFESGAVDGATAVAYDLDTENALANASALLLRLRNNSVSKFVIDKDGNITTVGTVAGVVAKSTLTAKGDILTATAAATPSVLSVGGNPDGFVLALDSSSPSGIKWSSAGAGDMIGPGSSTDTALVVWNGVGGTNVKDSSTLLSTLGIMTHGAAINYKRKTNADSAIALANALKGHMNTHAADGSEHFHSGVPSPDTVNFPIVTADATDLTSLLALTTVLLTAYAAHDADAASAGGGTYHNEQANANTLVSAVAPTDLDEAVARLNDLKAKYNLHYQDPGTGSGASHTASTGPAETTTDSSGDLTTSRETIVAVVDTTSTRGVTLADIDKVAGRLIYIKDESGGATAQNITVTPESGNIDGAGSLPISADYGVLRVYSDGVNWFSL